MRTDTHTHTYITLHYIHRDTDRQTDRQDEANSPFSLFCQPAHNAVLTQYTTCSVNLTFWLTLKSAAAVWVTGQFSKAVAIAIRDPRATAWVKGSNTPKVLAKVTPSSRTLLEDLTGPQPVKKLSHFKVAEGS
jgi:hypothetical protein